jgi:hypothetical protein
MAFSNAAINAFFCIGATSSDRIWHPESEKKFSSPWTTMPMAVPAQGMPSVCAKV